MEKATDIPLPRVLRGLGLCPIAQHWARGRKADEDAWVACPHPDWLLTIAVRIGVDRRLLVAALCDCAETALPHLPAGETRPAEAIRVARQWTQGEASTSEVRAAADRAAPALDGGTASGAAARAAYATATFAARAGSPGDKLHLEIVTSCLVSAHASGGGIDAVEAAKQRLAEIVRRHLPWEVIRERLAQ